MVIAVSVGVAAREPYYYGNGYYGRGYNGYGPYYGYGYGNAPYGAPANQPAPL